MDGTAVRAEIDRYLDEHNLKLVQLPVHDAMDRRAICLKLALETMSLIFLKDESPHGAVDVVLAAAARYEAYIAGEGSAD